MFKKAFSMAELVVAMGIIAILAMVTIPIAHKKLAKVDTYSYYMGYRTMQDITANIISQSVYDERDEVVIKETAQQFCEKIKKTYSRRSFRSII